MMTAYGSVKQAVRAVRLGATDYLLKPVDMEELEYTVTRVLETARLHKENFFLKRQVACRRTSHLLGDSVRLKETLALIEAIAPSDMTVLIEGESGVGKELVARELHDRSQRKEGNFVALDCCTLQEKLFESELFGHERGAFTGADRVKQGLIELADGGTLFLDEIGEIDAVIQAKLLRILETGNSADWAGSVSSPRMCGSWRRPIVIWREWSTKVNSARTCFTACPPSS
jgi:DNA-binding NtrC family response regulator